MPPYSRRLGFLPILVLLAWSPAALAAEAQGTFTSTGIFDCSGTGEFVGAEDFCEACDSDGTWDVSVLPTPSPGSLAGIWSLYVAATDYCPDEEPEPSPRVLALPSFPVMQQGAVLSSSFLSPAVDTVGNFLGVTCLVSCPVPGSCNVNCPELDDLSCTASCTPATEGCRDQFGLSGTVSNGSVQATLSRKLTVVADCPGFGTLTVVGDATVVLTTPEPQLGAAAAGVALGLLRGSAGRTHCSGVRHQGGA
jgi:hypothetical protein